MFATYRAFTGYIILWAALWAALQGSYGCASIGAPTGGPRDSLPPVLIKANPGNYTPNFNSRTIVLSFDEYVDLDGVFEKLIINPPLDKFPQVDRKLSTVTIRIKDTLEPNTTYSWRFDDVIKDVNEGNPLGDYTYVFSTGSQFDSASFAGRILEAKSGKPDSTLLVVLHRDLTDSAVAKVKPRYITKMDGKGFFRFNYLAPGNYHVFAFKDEGMKRYADASTPFAFYDSVIEVSDNTPPVDMLFFVAKEKEPEAPAAPPPAPKKPAETETDENGQVIQKKKVLKAAVVTGSSGAHDVLQPLPVRFSQVPKMLDTTRFILTDTLFKPIGAYTVNKDTNGTGLLLTHAWKLEQHYALQVLDGAAEDSAGIGIAKPDTLYFKTKGEADYGLVKLQLQGLDFGQHPVLQWWEGERLFRSVPLTTPYFSDKLFKPGDYEIRILLDKNQNGVWDTGDYWKRKQPERVLHIWQKVSVRGNWENEYTIDINAPEPEKEDEAPVNNRRGR